MRIRIIMREASQGEAPECGTEQARHGARREGEAELLQTRITCGLALHPRGANSLLARPCALQCAVILVLRKGL